VLGLAYDETSDAQREAVVHAHPRSGQFKEDIIQAFYDGIKHQARHDIPATSRPMCSRTRIRLSGAVISAA